MKTILVPTDFSECANSALEYAAMIARKTNSRIYLLHVLDIPGDTSNALYMMAAMKVTKARMKKLMRDPILKDIEITDAISIGSVSRKINEAAKKHKADMIALGTHGRHGLSHFFNGSIAEDLVNHSPLPVLTTNIHKESIPVSNEKKIKQTKQNENSYAHQLPVI